MNELEQKQHILSAVYDNKKFIERVIGVTKYEWKFEKVHYHGTCRMPVPFNDFDAVICGVLFVKPLTFSDLGLAIGLNVNENKAAECLLKQAIDELNQRGILVCDDQIFKLTEYGISCQNRQLKPDKVEREFELIFNATGKLVKNAHKLFKALPLNAKFRNIDIDDAYNLNIIDDAYNLNIIKEVAAEQQPEIHCPEKEIILSDINEQRISANIYSTELYVAILHNCRDNTLRALVFDEINKEPIEALSNALSRDDYELKLVVDRIIKNIDEEDNEFILEYDNRSLRDRRISDEEKKQRPKIDKELVLNQQQYDDAIENNKDEEAAYIREQALLNKRYFDSIEFEQELHRLFDTTNGDIWIVSPWLKKAAERLVPLIENYLKKGGRVFICYSKPESYYDQMADEKVLKHFFKLDEQYRNFYIAQSERPFHDKHLFLRNVENPIHYTGSYNILSFNASHFETYSGREIDDKYAIRQETMIKLDWIDETEHSFFQYHNLFASHYVEKAEKEIYPIAERIYLKAKRAYDFYGYKLYRRPSSHNYDPSSYWGKSYPYEDFSLVSYDFETTPKVFIEQEEREELQLLLKTLKFDYLKPFTHLKSKYIVEKNIPLYNKYKDHYVKARESDMLIDSLSQFAKLLLKMNKI